MIIPAATVRVCLVLCLVGMALIAALYLRSRHLSWWEYLAWGLFALLVPILGPFITILSKPGTPRHSASCPPFQKNSNASKSSP